MAREPKSGKFLFKYEGVMRAGEVVTLTGVTERVYRREMGV